MVTYLTVDLALQGIFANHEFVAVLGRHLLLLITHGSAVANRRHSSSIACRRRTVF